MKKKIVNYSDSSDQEEQREEQNIIKVLEGEEQNLVRIRKVPHLEGFYAGYLYIEIPSQLNNYFFTQIQNVISLEFDAAGLNYESLTQLHISISKTIYFNLHQIEDFQNQVQNSLKYFTTFSLILSTHQKIKIFQNEDLSRSFFALQILSDQTIKLIDNVNLILIKFGFSTFFEEPELHCSLCWTSNSQQYQNIQDKILDNINQKILQINPYFLKVSYINFKIGEKIIKFYVLN